MEELLKKLIELIETASPHLWEILLRQVYIDVLVNVVLLILSLAGLFAAWRIWSWLKEKGGFFQDDFTFALSLLPPVLLIFCTVSSVLLIPKIINGLMNPEYQAILLILDQLK